MTNAIIAILLVIALFVIYGVVRPSPGCSGHCGSCGKGTCETEKEEHHV